MRRLPIFWGPVAAGVAVAIGLGSLIGVGINFTPIGGTAGGEVALLFLFFSMQFLAGYVTGRFAASSRAFHGAVAGLGTFAVPVLLSSVSQIALPLLNVLGGALIATGLGYAGGLLTRNA